MDQGEEEVDQGEEEVDQGEGEVGQGEEKVGQGEGEVGATPRARALVRAPQVEDLLEVGAPDPVGFRGRPSAGLGGGGREMVKEEVACCYILQVSCCFIDDLCT